jgi:hypothetical protein
MLLTFFRLQLREIFSTKGGGKVVQRRLHRPVALHMQSKLTEEPESMTKSSRSAMAYLKERRAAR